MATPETAVELLQQIAAEPQATTRIKSMAEQAHAYLRAHDAASVQPPDAQVEGRKIAKHEHYQSGWDLYEGDYYVGHVADEEDADAIINALASQAPATDALAEALLEWSANHAGIFVWEQDSTEYLNDDEGWNSLLDLARAALGQQQENT